MGQSAEPTRASKDRNPHQGAHSSIRFCKGGSLNVRFTPKVAELLRRHGMTRCANSRHQRSYSITLSARAITVGGTVMPSFLAVLTSMVSSNVVGCCIGKSAGLAPLRILST